MKNISWDRNETASNPRRQRLSNLICQGSFHSCAQRWRGNGAAWHGMASRGGTRQPYPLVSSLLIPSLLFTRSTVYSFTSYVLRPKPYTLAFTPYPTIWRACGFALYASLPRETHKQSTQLFVVRLRDVFPTRKSSTSFEIVIPVHPVSLIAWMPYGAAYAASGGRGLLLYHWKILRHFFWSLLVDLISKIEIGTQNWAASDRELWIWTKNDRSPFSESWIIWSLVSEQKIAAETPRNIQKNSYLKNVNWKRRGRLSPFRPRVRQIVKLIPVVVN